MLLKKLIMSSLLALAFGASASQAPDFELPSAKGHVQLSKYKGKVVYLDFWASWCAPCKQSFPFLSELQDRYKSKGLVVIAVNLDENKELADQFLAETKPTFTIAYDPKGSAAQKYKVRLMPSSYIINRRGVPVSRHFGFKSSDKNMIEINIQKSLNQR